MLEKILFNSVENLLQNKQKHKDKFKQTNQYEIFEAMLRKLNIKFEIFIKELMRQLVENSDYEILAEFSGKKKFSISKFTNTLIENHILKAQIERNFDLPKEFNALKNAILKDKTEGTIKTDHDIDLLFRDKNGQIYYTEIKYNDDHDTDKFVGLNRKIIKTYAYLVREFGVDIKPILFYFNNKRMKGNIYLPENECIYRGERFFKEFLKFDYAALQRVFENFAESNENLAKFNDLYRKIMK